MNPSNRESRWKRRQAGRALAAIASTAVLTAACGAHAQGVDSYASKPLKLVVGSAAFRDKLADEGAEPLATLTPADSQAFFQNERARLTQIARDNAIKPE
jgi:hypothetical protein